LFKMMAGVDMVHVPYRGGGPAFNDLLAGQVQVMFPTTVSSIGYIRAGRLRALAVTAATRSDVLPDIPTVGDFVRVTRRVTGTASARPGIRPLR
jgi:tripartite-type tricarboxylate transporter receptor subunit TctC